jgi:hypothetical protein
MLVVYKKQDAMEQDATEQVGAEEAATLVVWPEAAAALVLGDGCWCASPDCSGWRARHGGSWPA